MVKSHEESVFVFQVDNIQGAEKILKDAGFSTLRDKELYLL